MNWHAVGGSGEPQQDFSSVIGSAAHGEPTDVNAAAASAGDDDLAMTVTGEYQLDAEPSEPSDATSHVIQSVDVLLDDLLLCRTDVLQHFVRSRGLKWKSKQAAISDLLDLAQHEADNPKDYPAIRKVLGDILEQKSSDGSTTITQGQGHGWSNESLEASLLENACQNVLKGAGRSAGDLQILIRSHAKNNSRVLQRLLRAYQEDYAAVASAAVGGVYRQCKEDAACILSGNKPIDVLACFSAYLTAFLKEAADAAMIARTTVGDTFTSMGVVHPTIHQIDVTHLSKMIDMIEDLEFDIVQREAFWDSAKRPRIYGRETHETLLYSVDHFVARCREWQLDDVPSTVMELATQFSNWEMIVRNDVPSLAKAPKQFFDILLLNVAALKFAKDIYGSTTDGKIEVPAEYRRAARAVLENWVGDHATDDIILNLHTYSRAVKTDSKAGITPGMCEAILSQIQASVQTEQSRPPSERVALILREAAQTASRSESCAGTYSLLLALAQNLRFHLRFSLVYKLIPARGRRYIREQSRLDMNMLLRNFEKEFHVTPVDCKSCIFLCIVLLYLCTRSQGQMMPIVERFASCTGREELSIIKLGDLRVRTVSSLKVALPPQLSYGSWLSTNERTKSVYSMMVTGAVKGSANDIMLASRAPMIQALDAVSRVPWRICKFIMFVQEAMLQEGFAFGKMRPGFHPLRFAQMKSGFVANLPDGSTLYNHSMKVAHQEQMKKDWRALQDVRGSRIHYLLALRQARALMNRDEIFFPHNMDFRGRMYPMPGRLNHTGSDPFRALLENAHPKELGKEGLFWLKVHLANRMGQSKLTFEERAQYVDEHIEDVVQSAEAPLSGDRWWQDGSDPMQALQACKELADALKYSQGAEKFPSRIPVAVDGSYNGLQHYSAIGRDEQGARLVNLVPLDRPSDAYTGILSVMMRSIVADAKNDNATAQRCIGTGIGLDKNHIRRKTIKRPIMTQVYGVTDYGMQEQIMEELKKQNESHNLWTTVDIKEMSGYLRDKLMESLGVTFRETQLCRSWLGRVARLIWDCQPSELRNAFTWTTPLGLVVRQPYRRGRETEVFTPHGFSKIGGSTTEPASIKQLSALAPNVIHSMDATHLAMTAIEMQNLGLNMMAVHDSYWSHACDLPTLSRVLREQFVALYENFDPLREFKEQWEEVFYFDLRRHGVKLPDPPPRGNLDMKSVLNSPYFFS